MGVRWRARGGVQSLSQVVTGVNLSVGLSDGQRPRAEWGDQLKTLGSSAGDVHDQNCGSSGHSENLKGKLR